MTPGIQKSISEQIAHGMQMRVSALNLFTIKEEWHEILQSGKRVDLGSLLKISLPYGYHPDIPIMPNLQSEEINNVINRIEIKKVENLNSLLKGRIVTDFERKILSTLSSIEKAMFFRSGNISLAELKNPSYEKRKWFNPGDLVFNHREAKNSLESYTGRSGAYLPGTFPIEFYGAPEGANVYVTSPWGDPEPSGEYVRTYDLPWYAAFLPENLQNGIWTPKNVLRRMSFLRSLMKQDTIQGFCDLLAYAPSACYGDGEYPKSTLYIFKQLAVRHVLNVAFEAARNAGIVIDKYFAENTYANMINTAYRGPAAKIDNAYARIIDGNGYQRDFVLTKDIRDSLKSVFTEEKLSILIDANLDKLGMSVAKSRDPEAVYYEDEIVADPMSNPFVVFDPERSVRSGKAVWRNISMPSSRTFQSSPRFTVGTEEQLRYMEQVPDIRSELARTFMTAEGIRSRRDIRTKEKTNLMPLILAGIAAGTIVSQT